MASIRCSPVLTPLILTLRKTGNQLRQAGAMKRPVSRRARYGVCDVGRSSLSYVSGATMHDWVESRSCERRRFISLRLRGLASAVSKATTQSSIFEQLGPGLVTGAADDNPAEMPRIPKRAPSSAAICSGR